MADTEHAVTRTVVRKETQKLEIHNGVMVVGDIGVEINDPVEYECSCGEPFESRKQAENHLKNYRIENVRS